MGAMAGSKQAQKIAVEVEGRRLQLSNLDKVLYPATGFTKGEVIDYYSRIAPVLLPHLAGRAATRVRFPDGVDGNSFFEKNAPKATPEWVRTVTLPTPGSSRGRETIDFVVVEDVPTLIWLANLAALELHVHQWTVGPRGGVHGVDRLVFDLDPGAPAALAECAQVALMLREVLADLGLEALAKTSGSKGMQLYVGLAETDPGRTHGFAKDLAVAMEEAHPELVVHRMEKALRGGKVLIDWSQNAAAKTTVAPYSLRARVRPTVSTPVTWDEVAEAAEGRELAFTAPEVLARVDELGDLFAPLLTADVRLP
ncbi:non-homologous end-joining DNA ligase [Sporichthya brevicatena]|uniref:Non-homologous end-joining DNA ligase n=1 Tax=Sporichthya brevicatena TaxID=171442 RepID=A0ABN1G8H3_9ACTN